MKKAIAVQQCLSMTSREIAELTGKEHKNVIRDIRDLLTSLYDLKDGSDLSHEEIQGVTTEKDTRGYLTLISLDKDHTLTLLSGYDAKARFKIVKRWQELETSAQQQATAWNEVRKDGVPKRVGYTATLRTHGVVAQGYARCTNALYHGLLKKDAKEIRQERGLKANAIARDGLGMGELAAVALAEISAAFMIEQQNKMGNSQCAFASYDAAKSILNALPLGVFDEEQRKLLVAPEKVKQQRLSI